MQLDRRNFLRGLGALVGGVALEQAIPFNRVWSFPSKVVIKPHVPLDAPAAIFDKISLATLQATQKYIIPMLADNVFRNSPVFGTTRLGNRVYLSNAEVLGIKWN